jgi:hypothetical protein
MLFRGQDTTLAPVWEIGILDGMSPLEWKSHSERRNPAVTARDVTDIEADFVADPFMVYRNGIWHLFFETFRKDTRLGEIGLAISTDTVNWEYRKIVLREHSISPTHMFSSGKEAAI